MYGLLTCDVCVVGVVIGFVISYRAMSGYVAFLCHLDVLSCVGGVGVLRLGFGQVRGGMGVRDVEFHEVVVMCVGVL